MDSTPEQQSFNPDQVSEWIRSQFQKANLHLAEKGILQQSVAVEDSRYLPPYVAIWKINAIDKHSYWVISGDLPSDYVAVSAAENARDALRAFSFRWQLQAQKLIDAGINDQTSQDYVNLLVSRAQSLYELFENQTLWK